MTNEPEFNGFDNGLRILAGMIARVYEKDKTEQKIMHGDEPAVSIEQNRDTQQLQRKSPDGR
jgi:hypothetical protein